MMTALQEKYQADQEIKRNNRALESIREAEANTRQYQAEVDAKRARLEESMLLSKKFNNYATGIGSVARGVGSIVNPLSGAASRLQSDENALNRSLMLQQNEFEQQNRRDAANRAFNLISSSLQKGARNANR